MRRRLRSHCSGPFGRFNGELRPYPIGHFDLFTGHWFDQAVGDQVAFLRRTLLGSHGHHPNA